MKVLTITLALWAAIAAPASALAAAQAAAPVPASSSANASILMYHHIAVPPASLAPADAQYFVPPTTFERHVFWLLSNGFQIVPLEHVVAALSGGPALPPKSVATTIDDGWQDFFQNGLPIVRKYEIPVTLFVIADADKGSYMTPAERWALAHSGVDLEAHTLSHPHLTRLLPAVANAEIANSRKSLEKELGTPVQLFAYPYGDFNDQVQAMVQAANYQAAFAAGPGSNEDGQHLLSLPRVMVSYYDTPDTFAKKAADYRWARAHAIPLPAPAPAPSPGAAAAGSRPVTAGEGTDTPGVPRHDMPDAVDPTAIPGDTGAGDG